MHTHQRQIKYIIQKGILRNTIILELGDYRFKYLNHGQGFRG